MQRADTTELITAVNDKRVVTIDSTWLEQFVVCLHPLHSALLL